MRNCIIMGCGRSGTSLMASVVRKTHYQGVNLLPPSEANPKGFFEDRALNRLNERIMETAIPFTRWWFLHQLFPRSVALRGNGWMSIFPLEAKVHPTMAHEQSMKEWLQRTPFCFKDPRFSYTYPAWRPWLKDTTSLVVFRKPDEVVTSVHSFFETRRVSYQSGVIYDVWFHMYAHILRYVQKGGRWLFIDYQDLLSGDRLNTVEEELCSPLDREMIDPALNRSRRESHHQTPPPRVLRMYRQLSILATEGTVAM